jgi:hypothetical protein
MPTTSDLLKDVCANFLDAYGQNPQASSENIIAFEQSGIVPGLTIGNPNSAAVAVEFVSDLADAVPDISSGLYMRTTRSLSLNYGNMLAASVASAQPPSSAFNATKASAQLAFDNSSLGSEGGPTSFEPVNVTPANWYDPSQQTNWLHYSYSSGTPAAPVTPPSTGSPTRPPVLLLASIAPWRLTAAASPAVINRAPIAVEAARPPFARASSVNNFAPEARVVSGIRLNTFIPPVRVAPPVAAPPAPPPQPTLQPEFAMSFDYCIVQLTRQWLSGDFLAMPGWYVPGMTAGDYASGATALAAAAASSSAAPVSSESQIVSGPAAAGPLTFLPTAFVAIKNLSINVTAIQDSSSSGGPVTAFGPFSLAGATGSANALTAPGIQIIGWISQVQPQLPPATDPALAAPTSAATALTGAAAS